MTLVGSTMVVCLDDDFQQIRNRPLTRMVMMVFSCFLGHCEQSFDDDFELYLVPGIETDL